MYIIRLPWLKPRVMLIKMMNIGEDQIERNLRLLNWNLEFELWNLNIEIWNFSIVN